MDEHPSAEEIAALWRQSSAREIGRARRRRWLYALAGIAAILAAAAMYGQGKLDPWLVKVGLNHTHCVRDAYGQEVCGADVKHLRHGR